MNQALHEFIERESLEGTLRRVLREDHSETLAEATYLALDLIPLGEHEQARPLDEDTLARLRHVLDDDHPDILGLVNKLAIWLDVLGENEQARALAEDTLTRSGRVLSVNHLVVHIPAATFG